MRPPLLAAPLRVLLLITVVLPLVLAGPPAGADSDAPSGPRGRQAERVQGEVDVLFRRAGLAAQHLRSARTRAETHRRLLLRLDRTVVLKRREIAGLRGVVGQAARAQYRSAALPPAVRLLLSEDPDALLRSVPASYSADQSVRTTLGRLASADRALTRDRRSAAATTRRLGRDLRLQLAARKDLTNRLAAARARLQRMEAARRAALLAAIGEPAPGGGGGGCAGGGGSASGDGGGGSGSGSGSEWVRPVDGYALSAGYLQSGARWAHRHSGQDFAVPTGTAVRSVGAGRVVAIGCQGAYGQHVVIGHSNGWFTQYAHLSLIGVRTGQILAAGQRIGLSGSTGNSTGPHLHFEVRVTPAYGSSVEPVSWLREHGVRV